MRRLADRSRWIVLLELHFLIVVQQLYVELVVELVFQFVFQFVFQLVVQLVVQLVFDVVVVIFVVVRRLVLEQLVRRRRRRRQLELIGLFGLRVLVGLSPVLSPARIGTRRLIPGRRVSILDGIGRLIREVQAQRVRQEHGHLAARHRLVGAERARAAAAGEAGGGHGFDEAEERVCGRHVVGEGGGGRGRAHLEPVPERRAGALVGGAAGAMGDAEHVGVRVVDDHGRVDGAQHAGGRSANLARGTSAKTTLGVWGH
jgi:hypothetical protein